MKTLRLAILLPVVWTLQCTPKPEPTRPRRTTADQPARPRAARPTAPRRIAPRRVAARRPAPRPVVAWRAHPPLPGPAPAIVTPKVESRKLKNGLTVLLVKRPTLPLVAFRLVIRAGSHEDREKVGVASMTADMLNEGVKGSSALQLSERAGQLGTTLSTQADEDGTHLSIVVLKRHARAALQLLTGAALRPTFPKAELTRRQLATVNHVRRLLFHPNAVASLVFQRVLFGRGHPYGRLDTGRPKDIQALTRADLVGFHRSHYRPDNAALVVVGDVSWDRVLPWVRRAFGGWRASGKPAAVSVAPQQTAGRLFLVNRPQSAQSVIRVGEIGPSRRHPDMVRLLVMNTILGGSFSSRINMNLREKHGYTYGAYSYFSLNRRPSPFQVVTSVKTAVTGPALREILRELKSMAGGKVSAAELQLAKQYLSVSVSGWFITNEGVSRAVSRLFLNELPLDFWTRFPTRVRGVTGADVAAVARRHLHPAKVKVVVVGDVTALGDSLQGLGLGQPTLLKP
ncbi:MAG: insulinase family protein [bacterium]